MDITIKADQVSVVATRSGSVELEITGTDDDFIKEVSKNASLDELLAGKTEAEIRTWIVNEYDWVQNLLNEFWQRSSDACPLDASDAEEQEVEFIKYVSQL